MFTAITRFINGHSRLVLALAVVVTGLAGWYASGVFSALSRDNDFTPKTAESMQVQEEMKAISQTKVSGVILFSPRDGQLQVTDEGYQKAVTDMLAPLVRDGVTVVSYANTHSQAFVSQDETRTYAVLTVAGTDNEQYTKLKKYVDEMSNPLVSAALGGELAAQHQSTAQVEEDLRTSELVSLPILGVLLLIIFRSVVAAGLPLLLGLVSIAGAMAMVRVLAQMTAIDQYALNIVTIMGLGLSVDYSLLMVSRFREELGRKADVLRAVERTQATAGRTVLFSGLTVMVTLGTLALFPIGFLRSIGLGGAATIVVALAGSLIILPALLRLLGPRINAWSLVRPGVKARRDWARFAQAVTRRPWVALGIALTVITVLSLPLRHALLIPSDYRTLPAGSSAREVAAALATDFSTSGTPVTVLVKGAQPLLVLPQLRKVAKVSEVRVASQADGVAVVNLYTDADSHDQAAVVQTVRDMNTDGYTLEVGGVAAELVDSVATLQEHLPLAVGIIVVAMFILLSLLLRSVVLPLQAMVINSLALVSSFGVLTFIFQEGHFTSDNWLVHIGGLSPSILLLIFAVAFGLSMDYAAFLYSRIREEYDDSGDTRQAIVHGLETTGGIITAAASILFVVMAAFAVSKIVFMQQVGIGLSLAVLMDAFVVRLLLVPAVMRLFGRANWYAPRWWPEVRG